MREPGPLVISDDLWPQRGVRSRLEPRQLLIWPADLRESLVSLLSPSGCHCDGGKGCLVAGSHGTAVKPSVDPRAGAPCPIPVSWARDAVLTVAGVVRNGSINETSQVLRVLVQARLGMVYIYAAGAVDTLRTRTGRQATLRNLGAGNGARPRTNVFRSRPTPLTTGA
jgi:hypothetical protein